MKRDRLKRTIGTAVLRNPVIAASGTFGYGDELGSFFDVSLLGGFVTKTITVRPREGNKPPRIYDLGFGVINSIGLANPGLEAFLNRYVDYFRGVKTAVFVSIWGKTLQEWRQLIRALEGAPIAGYELNFSCPNIRGETISSDVRTAAKLARLLRTLTRKTIIIKLAYAPRISATVKALKRAGADAAVLINTIPAMVPPSAEGGHLLGNIYGGLSGPCIKPVALRCVYEASRSSALPVIGCGGIMNGEDAAAFLRCGARCIQVGTATLCTPDACAGIVKELERIL